jgi:putative spermidine/putrescine transport system substrate-binding protein
MKRSRIVAVAAAGLVLAAGCGKDSKPKAEATKAALPTSVGAGEGALSLIAWNGYTESGKNDAKVDWVTPFEKESGCKVTVKYADTSDEMVTLMRQGGGKDYDGVSASGDATNRLIAGGDVAEINTALIKDFKDISQKLQGPPHNTIGDKHYGVSYMWGGNVLMYDTKKVSPAPDSWAAVFDDAGKYSGRITAYDSPIYIADAALYLKSAKPDLKITDPYELTEEQLDAAVNVLKEQRKHIKKYWALYSDEIDTFKSGDVVMGPAWPYQVNALKDDKKPVDAVVPKEGMTGWADTWMMSSHAAHPNCMYKWMDYATRPAVQQAVASWFGASPANAKTCDLLGKAFCDSYHVTDDNYFSNIAFWKTPLADCGDDRGKTCTDYSVWAQKWTEIKG